MGYNVSMQKKTNEKDTCEKCPQFSFSEVGSSSRTQCECIRGYIDLENANVQVVELVDILESPYFKESTYLHTLNCTNINECDVLEEFRHNCHADAECQDTQGSFICLCNAGYTGLDGTHCTACPEETYKTASGSDACTHCPPNSTSVVASTSLLNCGCHPGEEMSLESGRCEDCQHGHYSLGGLESCRKCPRATYSNAVGVDVCESCPLYSD